MLWLILHRIFIHISLLMSWAYKDGETDRNQSKRKISSSTKSYLWSQSSLSSRSVYLHSIIQWNCKRNSMMEYKKVMNSMVSWDFAVADTMSFTRTRCHHGKARSWNVLPHPRWPGTGSLCILRVCPRLLLGWIPPSRVAGVIKSNWIVSSWSMRGQITRISHYFVLHFRWSLSM